MYFGFRQWHHGPQILQFPTCKEDHPTSNSPQRMHSTPWHRSERSSARITLFSMMLRSSRVHHANSLKRSLFLLHRSTAVTASSIAIERQPSHIYVNFRHESSAVEQWSVATMWPTGSTQQSACTSSAPAAPSTRASNHSVLVILAPSQRNASIWSTDWKCFLHVTAWDGS